MQNYLQLLKNMILAGNIPQMIEAMIGLSIEEKASDIHIEPTRNVIRIRMRVDGILKVIVEYPHNMHAGVVSKLKIMANLKIDESRIPQDGRISTFVGEIEVDLRVSTLPTNNGEKIVMRVLDKSKKVPTLADLGIDGENYAKIMKAIGEPNGIILTSGPTGSGKTTTLYSCLSVLNSPTKNIMTFEDPIENQMDGLSQSQVRPNIGYTFAKGLRTALRQDPDIIMVGEIRDKETIDIAVEASLTGHLVLSTIHTNSAVDTIARVLNMQVPDFLLTASVNLIIAQRLARRLCPHCKVQQVLSHDANEKLRHAFEIFNPSENFDRSIFENPVFFGPNEAGCEKCSAGYAGRVGIYEILLMDEEIKHAILEGKPTFEIEELAQNRGMITLEQDGLLKVLEGLTSIEEVYKLIKNG